MVERLLGEDKLGLVAAGRLVGAAHGHPPVHPTTVARWCLKGIRLPSGDRLRLEHLRVGGKILTTRPALVRFLAAQTEPAAVPGPAPRTPARRRRAADEAARELDALGI